MPSDAPVWGAVAVAGGGTFVTFPALIFTGVPSIVANASNAVALFPASFASAWAYRHDFQKFEGVSLKAMVAVSLLGGAAGAALLLLTPQRTFDDLVPWLLLAATLYTLWTEALDFAENRVLQQGLMVVVGVSLLGFARQAWRSREGAMDPRS